MTSFNEHPETPTNLAGTPGENETDEDVVSPEVTEELNRLKTFGRPYTAPSADELMPRTFVYSQKTNEQLDKRMVAEGQERQLRALCSQNALFVIPRTALSPGTKMVRGRFVDDMKNGRAKNRFVAAEVARDVRHDVHAGTPALKALRMIVSLAATRGGKHRPRSMAPHDIVAAFVHASIDEVVGGCSPRRPAGERRMLLAVESNSNGFETVAAALHESTQNARMEREQGNAWILSPQRPCRNVRVSRRRFHGRR